MSTPSAISLKSCVLWAKFLLGIPLIPRPFHLPFYLNRNIFIDHLKTILVQSLMKQSDLLSHLHALCYFLVFSAVSIRIRGDCVIHCCIYGRSQIALFSSHSAFKGYRKKGSSYDALKCQTKVLNVDPERFQATSSTLPALIYGPVGNFRASNFDPSSLAPSDHDFTEHRNLLWGICNHCYIVYCLRRKIRLCALSQSSNVIAKGHCFGAL